MDKIKVGDKMLKSLKSLMVLSATVAIEIAESGVDPMYVGGINN